MYILGNNDHATYNAHTCERRESAKKRAFLVGDEEPARSRASIQAKPNCETSLENEQKKTFFSGESTSSTLRRHSREHTIVELGKRKGSRKLRAERREEEDEMILQRACASLYQF